MGKVKVECLFLALAVVVTVLLLHSHQAAAEELPSDEELHKSAICNGDLKKLMSSCKKCIKKSAKEMDPSVPCCRTIQKIDLLCICQSIPPKFEKKISMEKLVHAAQKCERPLAKGTKCGSYTVPMI